MISLRTFCDVFEQRYTRGSNLLKKHTDPRLLLAALFVLLPFSALAQTSQVCSGKTGMERTRCEELFSERAMSSSRSTVLSGGWRLVKTANPNGGRDAVSIMRAVDTARSDLNLAGLMFRCGLAGVEAVVIVLEPLSHALRPIISVQSGTNKREFEASVIQGGEAILLPLDASKTMTSAQWQAAPDLSLDIQIKPQPIKGVVPTAGLPAALQTLSQNCSIQ